MSLKALGMTLNNWAPLTVKEDSLAFRSEAGPFLFRGLTTITLPLLGELVKGAGEGSSSVPLYKFLGHFPDKDDHVSFSAPFLRVQAESLESLPIVHVF